MSALSTSVTQALQRMDVEAVIDECERMEQQAAKEAKNHPCAFLHMIGLLLANDLHEARFLYMRLDDSAREMCEPAWQLILMLRSGSMVDMNAVKSLKWPRATVGKEVNNAIDEVLMRIEQRAFEIIPRAYDVISRDDLMRMLGVSECDGDGDMNLNGTSLDNICVQYGWKVCKDDDKYIEIDRLEDNRPAKREYSKGNEQGQDTGLTQLDTLTEQLVGLQTT